MQSPMIALLGNGEEIQATYKTQLKFLYKNRQFTVPCFVFPTLKFELIIGTAYLYERQAIIVFETLSTYIRDDEGERVEFNNSIGELNQKVKSEYAVVLAEDVTLYPMSTHTVSVLIAEYGNDILPTFLEPTAFLMESILEQRGDEAFLVPSTLLIATEAKAYNWILLNKLNTVLTLPQGHQLGKAVLQSHTSVK